MVNAPPTPAHAELRRQQEQARLQAGAPHPIGKGDVLQAALAKARQRESQARVACVQGENWIRSDGFRYPERLERRRWARTREIIERCAPGPDEDASYFEMIARQAASVEMILRGEHAEPSDGISRGAALCDRILIGTFPTLYPDAFAHRSGEKFFVQVSAGLIEFLYQAAKAVVMSWKPAPPPKGASVSFKGEAEDVEAVLARNPLPVQLLRATLHCYLFDGLPRAVGCAPPPSNYQLPLGQLTNFNERFVIAHEYSHTLHDAADIVHEGGAAGEEYAADIMAFHFVAESGWVIDCMPPNFAIQGSLFVLTALDIIRRALDLARHGEVQEDQGRRGHPPLAQRLDVLRECYRQTVSRDDGALSIRPALTPARTLEQLFAHVLKDGVDEWRARPLHRIWDGA